MKIRNVEVDGVSASLVIIDFEHHEIHEGNHYFYSHSVELASAATQNYVIKAPVGDRRCHFTFSATGNAITQVDLYEMSDYLGNTEVTIQNNNRNSDSFSETKIYNGLGAGSTLGNLIYTMKSGSATGTSSRQSGISQRNAEIILRQDTTYVIVITSGTNDNLCNLLVEFYEHHPE